MNWIRISTSIATDPRVGNITIALRCKVPEAVGLVVSVLCALPVHARDGHLGDVPDVTIEQWAGWSGKRGVFATAFRAHLCDAQGVVRSWDKHNGAALREYETDRIRKSEARKKQQEVREMSGGHPADIRRKSGTCPPVTERYDTERNKQQTDRLVELPGETTPVDRSVGLEALPVQAVPGQALPVNTDPEPALPAPAVFGGERPDPVRKVDRSHYAEQEAALRAAALPHEAHALDALLHGHAFPDALVLELYSFATGMKVLRGEHTGRAADIADVMRAVAEMAANGQTWSVRLFRGYLRKIVDRAPEPPTSEEREAKRLAAQIAAQTSRVVVEPPRTAEEIAALKAQREKAMADFRAQFGAYNPGREAVAA